MIDFVGFSDGYRKQQETGERKRLELAKAFQEFQSQNPTANPMEFQAFIDSMAGGSNYLRGGMPSGDMLKAITDRATGRRIQAEKDLTYKNFQSTVEAQESIKGALSGVMLNFPNTDPSTWTAKDYTDMKDELQRNFPDIDMGAMNVDLDSMISPDLYRRLVADGMRTYMPMVTEYMQNADASAVTADMLKNMYIPPALIEPIIQKVQKQQERELYDWQTSHKQEILDTAIDLITTAGPNGEDIDLHGLLTEVFGAKTPDKASQFYTNLQRQATAAVNDTNNTRQQQAKTALAAHMVTVTEDGKMASLIAQNDDSKTLDYMAQKIGQSFTPSNITNMFGVDIAVLKKNPAEYLTPYLEEVKAALTSTQKEIAGQELAKTEEARQAYLEEQASSSQAAAAAHFGDTSKGDFSPHTALHYNGALAANALAKKYLFTDHVVATVHTILGTLGKDKIAKMEYLKVMSYIENDASFQVATGNKSLSKASQQNWSAKNDGSFIPLTDFGSYVKEEGVEIDTSEKNAMYFVAQIAEAPGMAPADKIKKLEELEASILAGQISTVEMWEAQKQLNKTANSGLGWVEVGGVIYDPAAVFGPKGLEHDLNEAVQRVKIAINAEIATQTEVQQTPQQQSSTNKEKVINEDINAPSETQSLFVQGLTDGGADITASDVFSKAVNEITRGGWRTPIDALSRDHTDRFVEAFIAPEADALERQEVRKWFNAHDDILISYGAELLKVGTWQTKNMFKMVERDLKTFTAEQLEKKYAPALQQLSKGVLVYP